MLPAAAHRASSGMSSSASPNRIQAGNIRTWNTIPLTMPKAARGLSMREFSARRLGTIRFSVVLMPDFSTSAMARGTAACNKRLLTGIFAPGFPRSARRSNIRQHSVRQAPKHPPMTTL